MKYNPTTHHRRSIRLKGYDYSQAGRYFITICVQNRQCLFGKISNGKMILNDYGKIVNDEWQYLQTKYPHIILHEYAIMPNHFHGIVAITDVVPVDVGTGEPRPYVPTLGNIIGYFKYQTTKKLICPLNYGNVIIGNALSVVKNHINTLPII